VIIGRPLGLGVICLVGWIAITALRVGATLYLMRFCVGDADNLFARTHVTQARTHEVIVVLGDARILR